VSEFLHSFKVVNFFLCMSQYLGMYAVIRVSSCANNWTTAGAVLLLSGSQIHEMTLRQV
jgi:hypothetical protein